MAVDEGSFAGLGTRTASISNMGSSTSTPIDSSNIGFQLLKKQGWKEGTGLGVSEQGRLEPIQAFVKKNKRGLGADKAKKTDKPKKTMKQSVTHNEEGTKLPKTKTTVLSKKMKKMQEIETRMEEKQFDQAWFRMFWPDNV